MKGILMTVAALGAAALFAEMPRSEWHAKVGDCALDPAALKGTMAQLSSADKPAFLAEVNGAISKMPGSAEAKAAKFLSANRAAVAAAGPADRAAVLAEVFATVPPESLTIVNEEFAKAEFSRPATMTDAEYLAIVKSTMPDIVQRTSTAEAGAVRAGFAGLMFIRAAGSTIFEPVTNAVVSTMPQESRKVAAESWFPSALGLNGAATYDPMLGSAQAGEEPSPEVVLRIAQLEVIDSMLGDLIRGKPVFEIPEGFGSVLGAAGDPLRNGSSGVIPRDRIADRDDPYYRGKRDGGRPYSGGGDGGGGEPRPYWLQGL